MTAIIKKGKDITTVAHFGRHIPAELRTAMIVSGRECSIEGCSGREYLELDHCEIDYGQGGPTARFNLAWLCSIHHTRKTQGWTLGPPDPITGKRKLTPPHHPHQHQHGVNHQPSSPSSARAGSGAVRCLGHQGPGGRDQTPRTGTYRLSRDRRSGSGPRLPRQS